MTRLLEGCYAKCERVILVCGNLSTHTPEAFEPEQDSRLVRRLEFHRTPKHSSWLDIAENKLSVSVR